MLLQLFSLFKYRKQIYYNSVKGHLGTVNLQKSS